MHMTNESRRPQRSLIDSGDAADRRLRSSSVPSTLSLGDGSSGRNPTPPLALASESRDRRRGWLRGAPGAGASLSVRTTEAGRSSEPEPPLPIHASVEGDAPLLELEARGLITREPRSSLLRSASSTLGVSTVGKTQTQTHTHIRHYTHTKHTRIPPSNKPHIHPAIHPYARTHTHTHNERDRKEHEKATAQGHVIAGCCPNTYRSQRAFVLGRRRCGRRVGCGS